MAGAAHTGPGAAAIAQAVALLRAGELVVFPTETVYGLGADAHSERAIGRIYALKGRPADHPLIVHLADAALARDWARLLTPAAAALAQRFWPGPLTLVVPRAPAVLPALTGGQDSVALRVPSHPLAQALLRAFGAGIAAPSANRYGRISPTQARHVREEFGAATPFTLDGGACAVGLESTIVACLGPEPVLLRPGSITRHALEAVVGRVQVARSGEGPRAPGSTASHYAPRTPLALYDSAALAHAARGPGTAVLARAPAPAGYAGPLWIEAGREARDYGHDLYDSLRRLDAAGAQLIAVEVVPGDEAWAAVRDRLARAAATDPGQADDP